MFPRPDVVSTGFALYDGADTAVVYQPYEDRLCLNVGRDLGDAAVEWRDLVDDRKRAPGSIRRNGTGVLIDPPWPGPAVATVALRPQR